MALHNQTNYIDRGTKLLFASLKKTSPFQRGNDSVLTQATARFPKRNRAMMTLLLDAGPRSSEIINLKFEDLDLKNYTITIKLGKGRKTRTAPFSPATAKAIWAYLEERKEIMKRIDPNYPNTPPPTDLVFINAKNKSIGRSDFWRTIERIGKRCGVHAYPHRFRHTFAIMYLRNGGNIVYLQQILGHSDLDMLKRYLAVTKTDLSEAHRRFSPVAGLGL